MAIQNFSPKFIKAKVVFQFKEKTYDFGEHLINASGVPGAAWTHFDPVPVVGEKVQIFMTIEASQPFKISCNGTLNYEQTERGTMLGLTPIFTSAQTIQALDAAITKEGVLPDYIRKYPRIPFNRKIPVMPEIMLIKYMMGPEEVTSAGVLDNLSPTGYQILTEDPRAHCILPGESVRTIFMPRGDLFQPVTLGGVVRRITKGRDPVSGNMRMFLGMSIGNISEEQKHMFTGMLRKVVEAMK